MAGVMLWRDWCCAMAWLVLCNGVTGVMQWRDWCYAMAWLVLGNGVTGFIRKSPKPFFSRRVWGFLGWMNRGYFSCSLKKLVIWRNKWLRVLPP